VRWIHRRAWTNYDDHGIATQINDSGQDVTAQKLAQAELARSEELHRVTLSNISDSVFITNDAGQFTFVCPNVHILFGYEHTEVRQMENINVLLGEPFFDSDQLAQVGEITNIEHQIVDKSGTPHDLWVTVKSVDIFDGTILYACRDVTDRKRAIEDLRTSESRLQVLLDSQTNYVVRTNLQGYHTYYNHKFEEEYGYIYTDTGTLGGAALNSICDYHHQRTLETVEKCMAQPLTIFQVELDKPRKDGMIRTTLWDFICLTNAAGEPTEIQCMGIDITDRVMAENALKASEKRYRQMFEAIGLPKLILDPQTSSILDANPAAEAFYGYPAGQLKTMTLHQINQTTDLTLPALFDQVTQHETIAHRAVQKLADGSLRDVEVYSASMELENKRVLYSICVDVTARNHAEQALEAAKATLEQRVKERTRELENAKERIEAILDHSGDSIVLLDVARGIQQVNVTFSEMFQTTMAHALGASLGSLFHQNAAETVKAAVDQVIASHTPQHIEARAVCTVGTEFDAEISISPINRSHDAVNSLVCIIRDVTERQKIQRAVAEERNLLRTVIDTVPDFIYVKDTQHRMVLNNIAHARSLGSTPEAVVGKTDSEYFPHEMATHFYTDEQALFETEAPIINREERSIGENGSEIWALTTKVPLYNLQGELTGLVGITHDVTDIKNKAQALLHSEQKLRESENMLKTVLDAIPVSVFWKDIHLNYLGCNRICAADAGLDNTESIVGKSDFDLPWGQKLATAYRADDRQVIESGTPKLNFEETRMKSNGEMIILQTSKIPLKNSDGQIIGMLGAYVDITEQKHAEVQLRYLASLQEHMYDGVIATDMTYRIQIWNKAAERMFGWTAEEAVGRLLEDVLKTKIVGGTPESAGERLVEQGYWEGEAIQTHRDGRMVYVLGSIVLNYDENGQPIGIIGVNHDITERKHAEEGLRSVTERLQLATESGGIGIWDWDTRQDTMVWDDQMYRLYGIDEQQFTGTVAIWEKFLHPADAARAQAEVQAALQGKKRFNTEFRIQTPAGSLRHIRAHANVYWDTDGTPQRMVGVNIDVTEVKKAQAALESALEKERQLSELKSRFVSMASHQFRTPLAAILANTETLSVYRQRMNDTQIETRLARIRKQVNFLKGIMEEILELARLQEKQIQYRPVWEDFTNLCQDIINDYMHQAVYHDRIIYSGSQAALMTYFDPHLMHHVVSNLVHNALKYSPDDKPVRVTLSHDAQHIQLVIQDEGIGIPPDDLRNLFEPFHRAANVGTIEGTGLGLTIVKQSVDLHGGTIEIDSTLDTGSTFTVVLPTRHREAPTDDKNTGH